MTIEETGLQTGFQQNKCCSLWHYYPKIIIQKTQASAWFEAMGAITEPCGCSKPRRSERILDSQSLWASPAISSSRVLVGSFAPQRFFYMYILSCHGDDISCYISRTFLPARQLCCRASRYCFLRCLCMRLSVCLTAQNLENYWSEIDVAW